MQTLREVAARCRRSRAAFTLVELVVVIAGIVILITITLPAVQKALFKGELVSATQNGESMYLAIADPSGDRDVHDDIQPGNYLGWPSYGATTEPTNNMFANSTDFFRHVVTNGTLEATFHFFALKGVPVARSEAEFRATNCPWCVVADMNDDYPATAPAFFTRNLDISTIGQTLTVGTRGIVRELGDAATPFGNRGFVFVTCGGGAYALSAGNLRLQVFTNLLIRKAADGKTALTNRVLRP